jgi:DNA replication and repair protein RecF
MPIRSLTLAGFRSYDALELAVDPGAHVVVGPNAAGKTNLIEALALLSRGRSHRGANEAEMIRWGHDFARVVAGVDVSAPGVVRSADPRHTLEVVMHQPGSGTGGRRRVRIDGVARRPGSTARVLRTVVFAPEDMTLISGAPALRRGFIDALVAQREPTAASVMSTYARALTQRNSLLRRIREDVASRDELAYWDTVLSDSGGELRAWRRATLEALAAPLAAAHLEIAPGEPPLTTRYLTNAPAAEGEDDGAALRRRLLETAEKEVWNGATLVGPHRDDVVLESAGRDLASFASRGQQRSAILALKLAELDLLGELDGSPPLLLLDDVFSELDPDRRSHLVRRIDALPQAIVTTTTTDDLDPALVAHASVWSVEPGAVRRVRPPIQPSHPIDVPDTVGRL